MAKAMSLLKAYMTNSMPLNGGFIVSSLFDPDSVYTIYEITSYASVKEIFKNPEGLVFRTDGNRTHLLFEPPSFSQRYTEPIHREQGRSIPYKFSELKIMESQNHEKLMVPNEAMMLYSSFTILDTKGDNFTFLFFPTDDVYIAIKKFLADSLYNDCNLTKDEALEGTVMAMQTIKSFSIRK
jgi:hypothetical protein